MQPAKRTSASFMGAILKEYLIFEVNKVTIKHYGGYY